MTDDLTFVNAQVPRELDNRLRLVAAEERKSRSEIVRIAIEKYLTEYRIVSVQELPGPPAAERPTVLTVAKKDE